MVVAAFLLFFFFFFFEFECFDAVPVAVAFVEAASPLLSPPPPPPSEPSEPSGTAPQKAERGNVGSSHWKPRRRLSANCWSQRTMISPKARFCCQARRGMPHRGPSDGKSPSTSPFG